MTMTPVARGQTDAAERRYARLLANGGTHRGVRERFGLGLDERALRRVAERYAPPAWAVGCIGVVDAMFLYDMVAGVRPHQMIEVGVAGGGSTSLLLVALADCGRAMVDGRGRAALQSFDLHPWCYFDRRRAVGSAVEEMAPELRAGLQLHVGMVAADAGRLLADDPVALAFIDADHRHPCPTADLLHLLPALAPGAWVVLHDIDLPAAAARYESAHGVEVEWHQAGAQLLYEFWPYEKFRGTGDGANIGAIRIPTARPVNAPILRDLIDRPWETTPDGASRRVLGRE